MALADNLNTNELKNEAGTEVEYLNFDKGSRMKEWFKSGEVPGLPSHLKIQHREIGEGVDKKRQSNISLYITEIGSVDTTKQAKSIGSFSTTVPIGNIPNFAKITTVMACLGSLCYTNGTNTFVYDGTTPGAAALINGTI
jgi:hypothetical protein